MLFGSSLSSPLQNISFDKNRIEQLNFSSNPLTKRSLYSEFIFPFPHETSSHVRSPEFDLTNPMMILTVDMTTDTATKRRRAICHPVWENLVLCGFSTPGANSFIFLKNKNHTQTTVHTFLFLSISQHTPPRIIQQHSGNQPLDAYPSIRPSDVHENVHISRGKGYEDGGYGNECGEDVWSPLAVGSVLCVRDEKMCAVCCVCRCSWLSVYRLWVRTSKVEDIEHVIA